MNDWEDELMFQFGGHQPPPRPPERKSESQRLQECFAAVMSFPEGVNVIRHIYQESGYADPRLMTYDMDKKELNPYATIYNLSKRDMWARLRELLTPPQKALIETEEQPWAKEDQTAARIQALRARLAGLL